MGAHSGCWTTSRRCGRSRNPSPNRSSIFSSQQRRIAFGATRIPTRRFRPTNRPRRILRMGRSLIIFWRSRRLRRSRSKYPISAVPGDTPRTPQGPMVLPGQYTVRLTVRGLSFSEPLIVKMDPRVKTSQEGLELEFQKQQVLAKMMTQNTEALTQARALREQLQKLTGKAASATEATAAGSSGQKISGPLADAVSAFDKKLGSILGSGDGPGGLGAAASASPTLSRSAGAISGLYGELGRADAVPTAAQVAAIDATEKYSSAILKLWQEFRATDVPTLNRQLKSAGLGGLLLVGAAPFWLAKS